MKSGVLMLAVVGVVSMAGRSRADEASPARARFQMAMRTGYSVPMGKAEKGLNMSDFTSGQVPVIVDIGVKVMPELFLGGYFGLGVGGAAGATEQACNLGGGGCVGARANLGIEIQYQILPGAATNPWLGYGFGFEALAMSQSDDSSGDGVTFSGFEFARFMAGVDFRVSRGFGVGPFVDLSLGQYSKVELASREQDVGSSATHEWLTLGARFVIFP